MATRHFVFAAITAGLIGGAAHASAYQPGDFLMLDLNRAALSPTPLGPPAQFEPVKVEAKEDVKPAVVKPAAAKPARVAAPHRGVRKTVARARGNPLDANASDTRIQVWPCRSGAICGWKK